MLWQSGFRRTSTHERRRRLRADRGSAEHERVAGVRREENEESEELHGVIAGRVRPWTDETSGWYHPDRIRTTQNYPGIKSI